MPYAVNIVSDECDGTLCYMASHPELYGCMAQGNTPEEALANLSVARADYIAALREAGREIPLPTAASVGPSA